MVSKLDKITMERLIMQVGFPYNINELRNTYKYNVDINLAMEFESQIAKAKNFNQVRQLVLRYETIFDKSIYVLHLGRLAEKDLDEQRRHTILIGEGQEKVELPKNQVIITNPKSNLRRCVVTAKELLKGESVADLGVNSTTGEVLVYTSKEFVDETFSMKKKRDRVEKKLEQIDEEIGLSEIIKYLSPSDLIGICDYPNLGNILARKLYKDTTNIKEITINGKNNANQEDGVLITDSSVLQKGNIFDWNEFEDIVRKYSIYIDLDKMLLLANSVFYNKFGNDFYKFTSKEAGELQDFTNKIGILIDTKKTVVTSQRFNTEVSYKLIAESVESLNKHFVNGRYYEYDELNKLIEDITNGLVPIQNITKREYQNTLKLTIEELSTLDRNNPEAIQYLIDNDMLKKVEIEEFLKSKQKFTDEQALYYINKGLINEAMILGLYNSNKLTIENLEYVKYNLEDRDLTGIVSTDELVELYLKSEKNEDFEKYRKLYKLLIIDETRKERIERDRKKDNPIAIRDFDRKLLTRRKTIGVSILDKSIELLNDDYMYDLYHKGLLQIDTIIDYIGFDAVNKLFADGELKPLDVKRLVSEKILTEEMLEEVFKSDGLTETQKLVLIYSTFSSESEKDSEMRQKCVDYMARRTELTSEPTGKTRNQTGESQETQVKNITDPWARWNLISNLDKDYSQEYLKDGHIIFYLPNRGQYIIEKLYSKNNAPAYGAATYILDEKFFKENEPDILCDEKVSRFYLVSLNKEKPEFIKKIIHTGWANSLIRYYDIENSPEYSEEEKDSIKKQAEMVEKSKRPMTRDDE